MAIEIENLYIRRYHLKRLEDLAKNQYFAGADVNQAPIFVISPAKAKEILDNPELRRLSDLVKIKIEVSELSNGH